MQSIKFKPIFLLALLLPLLGAIVGYFISNIGQTHEAQTVTSYSDPAAGDIIEIYRAEDALPVKAAKRPGSLELGIFLALVCGAVAVIYHYLKNPLAWIVIFLLSLAFSLAYSPKMGVSLSWFFLSNLALAALTTLLIKFVFFMKALTRFRMVLGSLIGAGLIAAWYRGLFLLTKQTLIPSWSAAYIHALLVFVFIAQGLSLADLFIQRSQLNELKASRVSEDEDEDA